MARGELLRPSKSKKFSAIIILYYYNFAMRIFNVMSIRINWLPIEDRFSQCVSSQVYKFFQKKCPAYMSDIFNPSGTSRTGTRTSFLKLTQPSRRTNLGQRALSYQGPSIWNKLPDKVKQSCSVNSFKHNLKRYYFEDIKKRERDCFMY